MGHEKPKIIAHETKLWLIQFHICTILIFPTKVLWWGQHLGVVIDYFCPSSSLHVETLTPNMIIFEGKVLGGDEV